MAEYDLPAMISYVLNITGQQNIFYIGHSQGTMIAFAKLSQDPVFAKRVIIICSRHFFHFIIYDNIRSSLLVFCLTAGPFRS